jgi:hypothetical protein
VLDLAYVGTFGENIGTTTHLNNLPYGTRFEPSSLDPTRNRPQPLPDNFLRPYRGYGAIPFVAFDATSNYHGLQTSLQRRLSDGVQLGVVYSWSRALDYSDEDKGDVVTFQNRREWNYGLADYDRTHIFAANYIVNLPGNQLANGLLKGVLGGWQISGLTRFQSGAPLSLDASLRTGCSNPNAPCAATTSNSFGTDITGGGDGWRAVISGNPTLPQDQRTVDRWFDVSVFSPPALAQQVTDMAGVARVLARGNVGRRFGRGPGIANTDLALFKNIDVTGSLTAQLRIEAYNVFNHTQFDDLDEIAVQPVWDQSGAQVNPAFGAVTDARDPRIMQIALRLKF